VSTAPEFHYSDLLPTGPDETPYRRLTTDGVSTFEAGGRRFLTVDPEAIRLLTAEAMHDIAHYLRPAHPPSCGGSSTTPSRPATTGSWPSTC
jgi:fumarate hydratase class I